MQSLGFRAGPVFENRSYRDLALIDVSCRSATKHACQSGNVANEPANLATKCLRTGSRLKLSQPIGNFTHYAIHQCVISLMWNTSLSQRLVLLGRCDPAHSNPTLTGLCLREY